MAVVESAVLKSKFRGLFVGVLTGDCLGWPFEGDEYKPSAKITAQNYFDLMVKNPDVPYKQFSDDYAMTKAVAKALIEKQPVDYTHIAKSMVEEFIKNSTRGYSSSTINVFSKLKESAFSDVFQPAKDIRATSGDAASRIGPVVLYYHKDYQKMIDIASKVTEITHGDTTGRNGALLQCIALHQALLIPPNSTIEVYDFLAQLKGKMDAIEKRETGVGLADQPYGTKLEYINMLLTSKFIDQHKQDSAVIKLLGNSTSAIDAVPTGIYCFLRAHTDIKRVKASNIVISAIQYAIGLGGATDLIASLAGGIGGCYMGQEVFDESLKKHLEFVGDAEKLADDLFDAHVREFPT